MTHNNLSPRHREWLRIKSIVDEDEREAAYIAWRSEPEEPEAALFEALASPDLEWKAPRLDRVVVDDAAQRPAYNAATRTLTVKTCSVSPPWWTVQELAYDVSPHYVRGIGLRVVGECALGDHGQRLRASPCSRYFRRLRPAIVWSPPPSPSSRPRAYHARDRFVRRISCILWS